MVSSREWNQNKSVGCILSWWHGNFRNRVHLSPSCPLSQDVTRLPVMFFISLRGLMSSFRWPMMGGTSCSGGLPHPPDSVTGRSGGPCSKRVQFAQEWCNMSHESEVSTIKLIYCTTMLEKYPTFFFFLKKKPDGFQWSAFALGDLEPSYACVNFFRLPIASVDGKQHLSEIMFSDLVWFSLLEKYPTFGRRKNQAYLESQKSQGAWRTTGVWFFAKKVWIKCEECCCCFVHLDLAL